MIEETFEPGMTVSLVARLLRWERGKIWAGRSIHEISKRDVKPGPLIC
jgi:hypothetical protein